MVVNLLQNIKGQDKKSNFRYNRCTKKNPNTIRIEKKRYKRCLFWF